MFIKEKVLSLLCILILPPTSGPNSLYTKVKIAEKKIKKRIGAATQPCFKPVERGIISGWTVPLYLKFAVEL